MTVNAMDPSQLGAIEETPRNLREQATGEDFMQILRSTLDDSGETIHRGGLSGANGEVSLEEDRAAEENSTGNAAERVREDQEAESTIEAAALAAMAVGAMGTRNNIGEAEDREVGRLTNLNAEQAKAGLADRGRNGGMAEAMEAKAASVGAGRLSAEQAALANASIEATRTPDGVEARAALAGETLSNDVTRSRFEAGAQQTVDSARDASNDSELRAQGLAALRDEQQRGSNAGFRRDGEARQGAQQALFDRQEGTNRGADMAGSEAAASTSGSTLVQVDSVVQSPDTVPLEGAGAVANPVAGMVMETTTNTAPGAAGQPAASEAITVQTEWLARQGGGTARILLSPPSLGEVAIQVTLRGGNVDVVMIVNEAAAQSVAENQADRLSQAFSNHDLRMENFEVRRGNPQDMANGDLGRFSGSESRDNGQAEDPAGDRTEDQQAANRTVGQTSTDQDTAPQVDGVEQSGQPTVMSAGPEVSVDLRI